MLSDKARWLKEINGGATESRLGTRVATTSADWDFYDLADTPEEKAAGIVVVRVGVAIDGGRQVEDRSFLLVNGSVSVKKRKAISAHRDRYRLAYRSTPIFTPTEMMDAIEEFLSEYDIDFLGEDSAYTRAEAIKILRRAVRRQ